MFGEVFLEHFVDYDEILEDYKVALRNEEMENRLFG